MGHEGIDGFRHDATNISEVFWRKLTAKLKAAQAQTANAFSNRRDVWKSRPHWKLPVQRHARRPFDFKLYDKLVGAIVFDEGSWADLVATNKAAWPPTAPTT